MMKTNNMNQFKLKAKFTEEFFEEFQYKPEFRSFFLEMADGMSPYEVIEHLCKSKEEIMTLLKRAIEEAPIRIII